MSEASTQITLIGTVMIANTRKLDFKELIPITLRASLMSFTIFLRFIMNMRAIDITNLLK